MHPFGVTCRVSYRRARRGTCNSGLDLYDSLSSISFNSVLHGLVDEIRPALPVALVACTLRTNEKTPKIPVKRHAGQQIFYFAMPNKVLAERCMSYGVVTPTGHEELTRVNDRRRFYANFSPAHRETTERMHISS